MSSKPRSSSDLPGPEPRKDRDRDMRKAIVEDADKTEGADRDLVHGEGGSIGLPVRPGEVDQDD